MNTRKSLVVVGVFLLPLLGCTSSNPKVESQVRVQTAAIAGWYIESGGGASFQPCEGTPSLTVAPSEALKKRAKDFGVSPQSPVYARLRGNIASGVLTVSAVEQFGSPTPVRDCPLTGVVTSGG